MNQLVSVLQREFLTVLQVLGVLAVLLGVFLILPAGYAFVVGGVLVAAVAIAAEVASRPVKSGDG